MHRPLGFAAATLQRRTLLAATVTALSALITGPAAIAAVDETKLPADAPMLYMVSAPDCPICRSWEAGYQDAFESSPERAKLHFVVLHVPTVRMGPFADEAWPADTRWIRDNVQARHPDWGTPLFVLVRGKTVVLSQAGSLQPASFGFHPRFLQAIRDAVGTT